MTAPRSFRRLGFPVAAAVVLLLAASRLWLLPARMSGDFNEGWNAFQAMRALGAGPLYPAPGALVANNYPPLSFFLVGWASLPVGDAIVGGRIVAGLALLAVAAEVAVIVHRLGGRRGAGLFAGLLLLGYAATLFRNYLLIDDPQWLAQALLLGGTALLLPPSPAARPDATATALAALLTVAGVLVKHNAPALPLAATAWLALNARRSLAVWLASGAGLIAAAAFVTHHLYGWAAFADIAEGGRRFSLARMTLKSLPVMAALLPLALAALPLLRGRAPDRRLDLLLIALPLAVASGIAQRGGLGVDRNAHFETLVVLAILAGVAVARTWPDGQAWPARTPLAWTLAPWLVLVPVGLAGEWRELRHHARDAAAWDAMEQRVRATRGPVACETQALCFWAGKGFGIDFFLYGERLAAGRGADALARAIREHRFAAIEAEPRRTLPPNETNPVWRLIDPAFRVAYVAPDGRRLLVPAR